MEVENDKPTVIALREIAAGKIDAATLNDMVEEPLEEEGAQPSEILGGE